MFKGFHLMRKQIGGGTCRPCMKDFDAVAIPIFHSRLEAWKFLRAWTEGKTTKHLRSLGYRCVKVKVEANR